MNTYRAVIVSILVLSIIAPVSSVFGLPSIPNPPQIPGNVSILENVTIPNAPPVPGRPELSNLSRIQNLVPGRMLRNMTLNQMQLMVMAQERLQLLVENANGTLLRNLDMEVWNNRSTEFRMNINRTLPQGVMPPMNSLGEYYHVATNLTEPLMAQFMVQLNQTQLGDTESKVVSEIYTWSMHNGSHWVDLHTETDPNGTVTVTPSFEPAVNNVMALRRIAVSRGFNRMLRNADYYISNSGLGENVANKVIAGKNYVLRTGYTRMALRSSHREVEVLLRENQKKAENLLSLEIDSKNKLRLQVNNTDQLPDGLPIPRNGVGYYLEIEANNTINQAELGSYMNQTQLEEVFGPQVNMSRLSWAFWNGAEWEPIMSRINEAGFLVANTTHFSTWSIVEVEQEEVTEPDPVTPDEPETPEVADDSDNREPVNLIPMPPMFTFIGLVVVSMVLVYNRRV